MIRKSTDEDITDKELENIINPFYDNYHDFLSPSICISKSTFFCIFFIYPFTLKLSTKK